MKATTIDTNNTAQRLQLNGTTLSSVGTDTNIDITITPKGTGAILISQTTAPGTTTDRLYNDSGTLFWNGTDLTTSGISWGDSITDTSGTGVTITAGASSASGTICQEIIIQTYRKLRASGDFGSLSFPS